MAVLVGAGLAFDAFMPVMLAVMEIPGCLVALYLVARLRHRGMDADGNMPGKRDYVAPTPAKVGPGAATKPGLGQDLEANREAETEERVQFALTKRKHPRWEDPAGSGEKQSVFSRKLLERSSSIRDCVCYSAASSLAS